MATRKKPTGRTGPAKAKVYSVESVHGSYAWVRANSIDDVLAALRSGTDWVSFTRVDGKELLINPALVFIVGEPNIEEGT